MWIGRFNYWTSCHRLTATWVAAVSSHVKPVSGKISRSWKIRHLCNSACAAPPMLPTTTTRTLTLAIWTRSMCSSGDIYFCHDLLFLSYTGKGLKILFIRPKYRQNPWVPIRSRSIAWTWPWMTLNRDGRGHISDIWLKFLKVCCATMHRQQLL